MAAHRRFPLTVTVSIEAKNRAEIIVALKKLVSDIQAGADRTDVAGSAFAMYCYVKATDSDASKREESDL